MNSREFEGAPEFRRFRMGLRQLLNVRKAELDQWVEEARQLSPRLSRPNAPGRKPGRVTPQV